MENTRILVVEDQEDIGRILKMTVEQIDSDYEVDLAFDAFEAMDFLRKNPYDLVITDYMMPDMDGLELLESVRNLSPDTQVVVISALPSGIVKPLITKANVEFFLSKPFTNKDIRRVVGQALARVDDVRQEQKPVAQQISAQVDDSLINKQLFDLMRYTSATNCFLVDSGGHLIAHVGDNKQTPLSALASLLATNATAALRIARLLNNPTPFQSTIYESNAQNVAVYMVKEGVFLVVVFTKKVKIGLIQHYARQSVTALADVLQS